MGILICRRFRLLLTLAVTVPPAVIILSGQVQAQKFGRPPSSFQPPRPPSFKPSIPSYKPPSFNPPKIPSYNPPNIPSFKPPSFNPPNIPSHKPSSFNPPNIPSFKTPEIPTYKPTKINIPQIVTVWKCSRCSAELGQGGTQPPVDRCPGCNAYIINGKHGPGSRPPSQVQRKNSVAANQFQVNANPGNPSSNPASARQSKKNANRGMTLLVPLMIVGVLLFGGLVATGIFLIFKMSIQKDKRRKRKRRKKRSGPGDVQLPPPIPADLVFPGPPHEDHGL